MVKLPRFKIPQQFILGTTIASFSALFFWLISLIPSFQTKLNEIFGGEVLTGITIGERLIDSLLGHTSLAMPDFLALWIGGGILVMLGTWIYNQDWSPNCVPGCKSTPFTKLALVLFYASLAATILLSFNIVFSFRALLSTFVIIMVNSLIMSAFMIYFLGGMFGLIN